MNIIVSDPKTGRAYSKKTEQAVFVGRKIGDIVSLEVIGLAGYKALIAGGSDKDGFPMKPSLGGQARKKLLMRKGIGIRSRRKGEKRRKRVRGTVIAQDIHQLNLKVTECGPKKLSEAFKKVASEEKTAKQRALEQEILSKEKEAKQEKPAEKEGQEEPAGKEEQPKEKGEKPAGKKGEKPKEEKKEELAGGKKEAEAEKKEEPEKEK